MKKNYLNNADLLKEIHKSKKSYCSFVDENHFDFDYIIDDINRMNTTKVREARKARAEKLTQQAIREMAKNEGISTKAANKRLDEVSVRYQDIKAEDLVVREMTYAHIPQEETKTGRLVYPKLKFPPFKHYVLKEGKWVEVVRSHWVGGIDNGYFDPASGLITNELAKMLMLLVERISRKGNFNGYTYLEDMKSTALVQLADVALKFDESKGSNPFAFYSTIIHLSFTGILNNEKRHRNIRDEMMMIEGYNPSFGAQVDHEMKMREK